MVKNMKQVNKMLEHVSKDMNISELAKVMEQFEQVRLINHFVEKIFRNYKLYLVVRKL